MNTIKITRLYPTPHGNFGVLAIDDRPICWTLEPNWRMNAKNDSCIINGSYFYRQYVSPKFGGMCIGLHEVYDRNYIAIHPGNTLLDTKGCILVGMYMGIYQGRMAVLESNKALSLLITSTSETGTVTITNGY